VRIFGKTVSPKLRTPPDAFSSLFVRTLHIFFVQYFSLPQSMSHQSAETTFLPRTFFFYFSLLCLPGGLVERLEPTFHDLLHRSYSARNFPQSLPPHLLAALSLIRYVYLMRQLIGILDSVDGYRNRPIARPFFFWTILFLPKGD